MNGILSVPPPCVLVCSNHGTHGPGHWGQRALVALVERGAHKRDEHADNVHRHLRQRMQKHQEKCSYNVEFSLNFFATKITVGMMPCMFCNQQTTSSFGGSGDGSGGRRRENGV